MPQRLALLTVHAHPDDEASKGAPTVARYHAEGVHTVLVCCTGGEEGDLQNPGLRRPGQPFHGLTTDEEKVKVAELRADELAASAEIIGFDEVVMLGYRDSGMPDSPANEHPDSFHQADLDEATGRLVAIIRRVQPQVLMTYGDDQTGYPHPDHLKVHDISVLAFDRAGDPDWYPDGGAPFQPSKLYYSAWSRARMLTIHETLLRRDGKSPFDDKWFERPDQDHRITTRVDVTDFQWARSDALRAHATQVDPEEGWWFGLDDAEMAAVYKWDDFILTRSLVADVPADDSERDLFAGVREVGGHPPMSAVQYRVIIAKKDEIVEGPDDADVVVTVPIADVHADGFDPAVAFMQGRLKSAGSTGELFRLLRSGEAASALSRLASPS